MKSKHISLIIPSNIFSIILKKWTLIFLVFAHNCVISHVLVYRPLLMWWRHKRNSGTFLYMTIYLKNATCHHYKFFYKKSKNWGDPNFLLINLKNIPDKMVLFLFLYIIYIFLYEWVFPSSKNVKFWHFWLRLVHYVSQIKPNLIIILTYMDSTHSNEFRDSFIFSVLFFKIFFYFTGQIVFFIYLAAT